MNLKAKTALVTGGGSGIGLALAKALTAQGVKTIISGRNRTKLENAKAQNPAFEIEVCDVTDEAQIKALVQRLETEYGGIDILVNNAGIFERVDYTAAEQSFEAQEREIDIDFTGPIRMTHFFLPMLKARKEAAIVNVSSGLAYVPLTLAPVYSATKAGVHAWTRSLRYQMRGSTVKIFELMPPLVQTDMVREFEGAKMMDADDLARDFIRGFKSDSYEITPGQSTQLKLMSRLAPGFIFNAVNKQFA